MHPVSIRRRDTLRRVRCAFVLGGGGKWGAVQVGMFDALVQRGIVPDVVVGCSIGSLNGAVIAADPSPVGVARLRRMWVEQAQRLEIDARWRDRARSFVGRRPFLFPNDALREMAASVLGRALIEDLVVPFHCVASSIERAAERWFTSGPVVDAVLASSAIPGLFPPVVIDGEHCYDGGLVDSIPLDRAVALGASEIFVLQVGRVEQPLTPPRRLYEAPLVAFEIARRHRFATMMDALPPGVRVHVLPSGNRMTIDDRRQLSWRRVADAGALIEGARVASEAYLGTALDGSAPPTADGG
jgi:NTE family protein